MARRALAAAALMTLAVLWSGAALLGWHNARWTREAAARKVDATPPALTLPWLRGVPGRAWGQRLRVLGDAKEARRFLSASLRSQPLYAPTWLDRAELLMDQGKPRQAAAQVDLGRALWPHRPRLLWRAAMLQVELGQTDRAVAALVADWAADPGNGDRVLALLRRLRPDPEALVNAARQAWTHSQTKPLLYQRQVLGVARALTDPALAAALWAAVSPDAHSDKLLLQPYLTLLLAAGDYKTASVVWQQAVGASPGVYNGSFEQPLFDGGFGWRSYKGKGFAISRNQDRVYRGKYSLMIAFAGTRNVNFYHLRQTVVVQPGQRYRLAGFWSGYEVTTRSGVYVDIHTLASKQHADAHIEPQFGTWSWQPFGVTIAVPDGVHLLEIDVRRRATGSLDRLIGGKVWFDDISLKPLAQTLQG